MEHAVFDGWSESCFLAAAGDCGLTAEQARALCPRGAADLAAAYHLRGDRDMAAAFENADLSGLRYSQKVAELVWLRVGAADRELVRRGMAHFALPQHAAEGAGLIWSTADAVWTALGDTSDDVNWYSKRAILSGVLGSVFLFWLGDTSEGDSATRDFIDRRIADVMRFERFKGQLRDSPALRPFMEIADRMGASIKPPRRGPFPDYPGWLKRETE